MNASEATGPLSGVTVLAIENFLSGPYGSMILGDFGAEVVKVEPPEGDGYRVATPNYRSEDGEMSYAFLRVNRNKRSVVLDLKSSEGRETFLRLVEKADVAVSPGIGFGEHGDDFVRIALVENEHRIRQAARNIKRFLASIEAKPDNVVALNARR